jgi:hypothetical protein
MQRNSWFSLFFWPAFRRISLLNGLLPDLSKLVVGAPALMRGRSALALCEGVLTLIKRFKAVSQLLWPDKGREVWFSLGENHEKGFRSPGFPAVRYSPRAIVCGFLHESRIQFGAPPSSTGNPGSVYTNCETA